MNNENLFFQKQVRKTTKYFNNIQKFKSNEDTFKKF